MVRIGVRFEQSNTGIWSRRIPASGLSAAPSLGAWFSPPKRSIWAVLRRVLSASATNATAWMIYPFKVNFTKLAHFHSSIFQLPGQAKAFGKSLQGAPVAHEPGSWQPFPEGAWRSHLKGDVFVQGLLVYHNRGGNYRDYRDQRDYRVI